MFGNKLLSLQMEHLIKLIAAVAQQQTPLLEKILAELQDINSKIDSDKLAKDSATLGGIEYYIKDASHSLSNILTEMKDELKRRKFNFKQEFKTQNGDAARIHKREDGCWHGVVIKDGEWWSETWDDWGEAVGGSSENSLIDLHEEVGG